MGAGDGSSTDTAPIDRPQAATGERRQVTVLFCDLVGSTELSSQLDPEDWQDVLLTYQSTAAEIVALHGGHVAQYLGDGILVYFGWPQTYENAAERAVRTGLALVDATAAIVADATALAARIGIHTGSVVVGALGARGRTETLVFGQVPNVAARIQAAAQPGMVLMSAATQRLVSGLFVVENRGPQALKGVAEPVTLYRVVRPTGTHRRLDVTAGRLTPFVGRQVELATLVDAWKRTQNGEGQNVLLIGDAGVGKSRLVHQLREHIGSFPHVWLECGGTPYSQGTPFHPIVALVSQGLGLVRDDAAATIFAKVERGLGELASQETVALLERFLDLPSRTTMQMTPEARRRKTIDLLTRWSVTMSARQSLVVSVEDLHWCDASSLELLGRLAAQSATARVMLIATARPEFRPLWPVHTNTSVLEVGRLGATQGRDMVTSLGGEGLPPETIDALVARAEGVPLYVEELTKAVLEPGTAQSVDAIPATLADSLMARLDRLSTAKEIAQRAAVVGREFSFSLLAAVAALDEEPLAQALARLVDAEIVFARGTPPDATYRFKHALVRDAAYQSLLRGTRQQCHRQIARVLADNAPAGGAAHPELLAHHYTGARMAAEAIPCWLRAGQQAVRGAAFTEAIGHFNTGLSLLAGMPDDVARDRQELELQSALGMALQTVKGYSAPDVDRAYVRARDLCARVGSTSQLISLLRGQMLFYGVRAAHMTALELGRQMLDVAGHANDPAYLVEAHLGMGLCSLYLGDFVSSRTHLEQGISLETLPRASLQASQYVGHSHAMCLSYLARTLWILGYADQALRRSEEGLALAQALSMPMTLAQAQGMHALIHHVRREEALAAEWSDRTIAYASEHGFPYWLTLCSILKGWLLGQQGKSDEGVAQFHRGLDGYRATGAKLGLSWFLSLMAELHAKSGASEAGLRAMTEALAYIDESGERYYEAEVHRLKGELSLTGGGHAAEQTAEECFVHALDVARSQHAKAWELRTAMSLARLWQTQRRRGAATELLSSVYGWFTEGFDTSDLRDARRLLDELNAV